KIHRQTTPVVMNEIAYGKRKMLRNRLLPITCRSSSNASASPAKTARIRNSTVKTSVLRRSIWNRVWLKRESEVLNVGSEMERSRRFVFQFEIETQNVNAINPYTKMNMATID